MKRKAKVRKYSNFICSRYCASRNAERESLLSFWCVCVCTCRKLKMNAQDVYTKATGYLHRNAITFKTYNHGIQCNYRNPVAHTASVKIMARLTAGYFLFDHFTDDLKRSNREKKMRNQRKSCAFKQKNFACHSNNSEASLNERPSWLQKKFIEVVFKVLKPVSFPFHPIICLSIHTRKSSWQYILARCIFELGNSQNRITENQPNFK